MPTWVILRWYLWLWLGVQLINFPSVAAWVGSVSRTSKSCRPTIASLPSSSPQHEYKTSSISKLSGFLRTSSRLYNSINGRANEPQSRANTSLPQHVAIICDGNSRWARAKGLPTAAGHAAGAERLVQVLQTLQDKGVNYCTLYAFSTENWQRPRKEVEELMYTMEQTARRFRTQVLVSQAKVKVLGDLEDERIPSGLRDILMQIESETLALDAPEPRQTVCLAINYGGRQDILNAAKQFAKCALSTMDVDSMQEDDLAKHLSTRDIPDPDLLIRTSGEHRLSNFLLWNMAYTELYFTDTLWPDFDAKCVSDALSWYSQRQRRFGKRSSKPQAVSHNS